MNRATQFALAVVSTLPLLASAPAQAQATRTWVSGVGDDANPCSRTAPCKTFPGAISKTAASGEINCLDSGGFGGVTITKSITLLCEGVVGGILASGGVNAIIINAAGVDVVIKGLDIDGVGSGLIGILFLQGNSLLVQDTQIRNFRAGTAVGIRAAPSSSPARVTVINSTINNNGGTAGGGIDIAPTGSASVRAVLKNVTVTNNFVGVTSNGLANIPIDGSSIDNNRSTGVASVAGGGVRIGRSMIVSNAGAATSGSGVLSYGDNQINNNGADTVPPSAGGYH